MLRISKLKIKSSDDRYYIVRNDGTEKDTSIDSAYFDIKSHNENEVEFVCKKEIGVFKPGDLCIQDAEGHQREVKKPRP